MLKYLMSVIFKRQCKTLSHRDFQMKIIFSFKADAPQIHALTWRETVNWGRFQLLQTDKKNALSAGRLERSPGRGLASRWRVFFRITLSRKDFYGPVCSIMP